MILDNLNLISLSGILYPFKFNMSVANASFADQIFSVVSYLNRYGTLIIFVFGSIGVLLNILIFSTDQELKKIPCARLFLASSIAASIALFSGLPTRMFNAFGYDVSARYDILCKGYLFTLLGSFTCSALFTALVSMERWLNSCVNPNYRMLSSMKNANRAIVVITILVTALYAQIFYCYSANLRNGPNPCSMPSSGCAYFNNFLNLISFFIVPCLIMMMFGSLTLLNIHRNLHRVANDQSQCANKMGRRMKRSQSTMTVLMFAQICLVIFSNLPSGIQKIYGTITVNDARSPERRAIEALSFQLFSLLQFVGAGVRADLTYFHGKITCILLFVVSVLLLHIDRHYFSTGTASPSSTDYGWTIDYSRIQSNQPTSNDSIDEYQCEVSTPIMKPFFAF